MAETPSAPARCMTVVQKGTAGPPLYCFHAFGGTVAPYGELAPHIGRDRLVLGLESAGLSQEESGDPAVLDMAHRYATEIAADPPAGRSLFLGYSLGAVLALEAARLLADLLDEPPLVVAVDGDPAYRSTGSDTAWSILTNQVLNVDLVTDGFSALPREAALTEVRAAAAAQRRVPPRYPLERLGRILDVCRHNEAAAAAYRPRPYPGPVLSIRSSDPAGGSSDAPDPWSPQISRLTVRRLPGDHQSIMSSAGYPALAALIRDL
ncbi:thioesterase domain-containing protein [Plantactinospora sp. CA-290183]|uniref:thioesterase domain-containing protein n=1 Tax=Plantactinospora sp. CA-290183 TaxID=3240006 RepID=UPI003D91AADE